MRPPMTPPPYFAPRPVRRMSPRAAVMLGLAGIMVATAVIGASHVPGAAGTPPVHTSAPSVPPTSEASTPALR